MKAQPLTDAHVFYSRAEIAAVREFNFPIYEVHHVFNLLGEVAGKATLRYADVTGKHPVEIAELVHTKAKPYIPLFCVPRTKTKPESASLWQSKHLAVTLIFVFAILIASITFHAELDHILTDVFDLLRYLWNK